MKIKHGQFIFEDNGHSSLNKSDLRLHLTVAGHKRVTKILVAKVAGKLNCYAWDSSGKVVASTWFQLGTKPGEVLGLWWCG